jgi:hypothetical protein
MPPPFRFRARSHPSDRIRVVHGDKASRDHDSDPVGQRHDLLKVGGDDEHGGAAIALAPEDRVISALAPTSTPTVGSSK